MIRPSDVDNWWQENGKFCSGCVEGKMKEHARIISSKPLKADKPGNAAVGDIIYDHGRNKKCEETIIDSCECLF